MIKLNTDKSQFLIICTQKQRSNIKNAFHAPLHSQHVMPAVSTRNLEVSFDDNCNAREDISQIYRTCYYHIRDFMAYSSVLLLTRHFLVSSDRI